MWIWLLMLGSIVVFRFLIPDAIGEKKKNLIFLGLSFVVVVFVMGSRSAFLTSSSDLYNYYRFYGRAMSESLSILLETSPFEPGYIILNKILAWIVPWNYFIVYFEAAFCTFVMFWYIYRNADSVFLGVIVYICLGPWQFFLTGFRQSIAVCICFIALEFMKKNKQIYDLVAIGCILLATTMHTTAWVFLVVFLIRRLNITKKVIIYASLCTLIMLLFIDEIVEFGNDILGKQYTLNYYGNALAGAIPILVYLGSLLLWYLIWSWNEECFEDNKLEIAMLVFGLCIYVLRYSAHIMERVSMYFTPVISVVLTNAISRQRTKIVRNIALVVCIAMCLGLYMYRTLVQYGEYYFYWEYLEELIRL